MTAVPSWARDDDRPDAIEHAVEKMTQDLSATRLNSAGTGSLPIDHGRAAFQLTAEERHNRATRPRSRRWKALTRIDEEVDRIQVRHSEAIQGLTDAEADLAQAPDADARSLAAWLAAGSRGDRPAATIYELQRDRDASQLLVNAIALELDQKLEERLAHIERHRNKMLADAQHAVDAARQELLGKVSELPALRQALLDARETMLWASHFPDPPENYGFPTAVALGMRKPVETTLGTSARIEYQAILGVLEADADTLASTFSREQQRRGLGEPAAKTPLTEALWDSDEANIAWKRSELERARRLGEYSSDLGKVADDARDFRP